MEKGQREYFLRQQLKAIQEELGEVDEQQAEVDELREQIEAANLPEHARKQAERELQRFERLPPQSAEHGVIRTYLEWIVDAAVVASRPRTTSTSRRRARSLDQDHYDIDKIKERILEFLAVRKLKPDARSAILCFVGPPGVGKTSLGKSIAARWAASSSASRSAACATSPRSAATAAPTSARCPARSSARCATPARTTRS